MSGEGRNGRGNHDQTFAGLEGIDALANRGKRFDAVT